MTNAQLYLAIGLPIVAVLTSLVVSLVQISGIREDMRQFRSEFGALRSEVHNDLAAIRQDIQILTGKVYELMGQKS